LVTVFIIGCSFVLKKENYMACQVKDIVALMEAIAPPEYAEDWDNVGLLVGSMHAEIEKVLVSLDATGEVVAEAAGMGAGLLISHHPPVFRPITRVITDEPPGSLVKEALTGGIALYAAHTNLDLCEVGVNVVLAEKLGLKDHRPLESSPAAEGFKLVTFLPPQHLPSVSEALFKAGAGVIGDYTGCSFRVEGTGTFTPGPGISPAYGEAGKSNQMGEVRLEVAVEKEGLENTVSALLDSHPYEEPAYDIYLLRIPSCAGKGRIGELPKAMTVGDLARRCSQELGTPAVRLAGDPGREVRLVAVCGGRGGKLIPRAARAGAEVMITGDVVYHEALAAQARGLAVIDAGHYHTERPVVPHLASLLERKADRAGLEVEVHISDIDTHPWVVGGEK
jgi:dinuclear metal center YbgI/SA1388 family protein